VALAADDLMGIGENLYMVTADGGSDGSGEATVSFLPPLRQGVAEDDVVTLYRPTGLFRLVSGAAVPALAGGLSPAVSLQFAEDPDFG